MNKAIFSIIITYVLLKQGYIGFLGNPVSPFASSFSSPFRISVMPVYVVTFTHNNEQNLNNQLSLLWMINIVHYRAKCWYGKTLDYGEIAPHPFGRENFCKFK